MKNVTTINRVTNMVTVPLKDYNNLRDTAKEWESCPLYDNIKGDCDKTNLKNNYEINKRIVRNSTYRRSRLVVYSLQDKRRETRGLNAHNLQSD